MKGLLACEEWMQKGEDVAQLEQRLNFCKRIEMLSGRKAADKYDGYHDYLTYHSTTLAQLK